MKILSNSVPARREGPGRPEGLSGFRDDILTAAEVVFSEFGYAGTSLRQVAQKAGVTTALINYYFGTKLGLYEELYLRQATVIAQARMDNLYQLKTSGSAHDPMAIVRAFVLPLIEMRATPSGRAFLKLQWSVECEPRELSYALRGKVYDESTHAYAAALHEALPDVPIVTIYARLAILIGANLYASSTRHRLDELLPRVSDEEGSDILLEEIVTFIGNAMAVR